MIFLISRFEKVVTEGPPLLDAKLIKLSSYRLLIIIFPLPWNTDAFLSKGVIAIRGS